MSFGADCLIQKINDRIAALEGCTYNAAQVSGSLNSIETYHCVPDLASLPAASCNEGRFIYVEDIKSFRYSDGYYWTKDACSVLGDVNTTSSLWSWGCNFEGQLGNGTTVSRCSPGTIAGGGSWCKISSATACGNLFAAIKTDGTLWTWGTNSFGQLGDGTTLTKCSPGTVAGGGTTWCQVSVGVLNTFALKTDGTLWTWGRNFTGDLGDGTQTSRCSPGTVAGGGTTWCLSCNSGYLGGAIKTDGTLWTWGCNICGSMGNGTTLARSSPGTIAGGGTTWCRFSATGNGSQVTSAAIKCDGTLWTWGSNSYGKLGEGTTVSRCSPGTTWGSYTTWCQVSIGIVNMSAIKTDGTLWTWGSNGTGALGDGTTISRSSPGTVAGGGTTWCQVIPGASIKTDGTLWTWGYNGKGALGNGTTVNRCSPGTVAGSNNPWCQISGGNGFVIAIKTRGF